MSGGGLEWEMALRLAAALVLGGSIGLERSYRGRAAGFRTYALVSLGSAIVMVASTQPARWAFLAAGGGMAPIDPTRAIQGLVAGVGFLGAGVIFRDGFSVRGLTTAASIWVTAAIGILVGMGMTDLAAVSAVLTLVALSLFRAIESRLPQQFYSIATVRYAGDAVPDEAHVAALLERHGFRVAQTSYRMVPEGRAVEFAMRVWSTRRGHVTALARTLAADPGVVQFRLSPMQE